MSVANDSEARGAIRWEGHARAFAWVMRVLGATPLLIGFLHITLGVGLNAALGAAIPPEVVRDPVLDSQDRFQAAVFMGYGALVYLSLQDLRLYKAVFRTVGAFIVIGGLGRLLSVALVGSPPPAVWGLIGIELVLMPLILWWHSRVLARL